MVHPTFDYRCKVDPDILLGDEATKVIINATGNRTGLSDEMSAFLDFVLTGKGNSSFTPTGWKQPWSLLKPIRNGR